MAKKDVKAAVEAFVHPKYPGLDIVKFGLAGGILCGLFMLGATIAGMFGSFPVWMSFLLDTYGGFGYNLTWLGAIVGTLYGFIDGFLFTAIFAWIYNKLLG